MKAVQIRTKTASDVEWAVNFLKRQFVYFPEPFSEEDIPRLSGLVAEMEDEPVGLLTYHCEGDTCHIVSFSVSRKRLGVGESLLKRLEAEAIQCGCQKLSCTISNDNLNALRFLQKRDFGLSALKAKAIEERRKQNPAIPLIGENAIPLRDELILEKKLVK